MTVISVENGRIAEHDALTLTVSWVKVLGKIRIRPPYSIYIAQMRKEKLDTIGILNGTLSISVHHLHDAAREGKYRGAQYILI
jgi:hypothetical protein